MLVSSVAPDPVTIILNGQVKPLTGSTTIATLLKDLGLSERRVAVEVNREIVPRSRHEDYILQDRDRVEIVLAIGGGTE